MIEYIYTGNSKEDLSRAFAFLFAKEKRNVLTNAFLRHCFSRWLFSVYSPSEWLSSHLSSLSFTFICVLGVFSFFFILVYILSVCQRIIAFRLTVHEEYTYMYVSFSVQLPSIVEKLFIFRPTSDSKINFNSAFICFVDWQRCTQVVIHVYENSWRERKIKRERERERMNY